MDAIRLYRVFDVIAFSIPRFIFIIVDTTSMTPINYELSYYIYQ